MTRAGPLCFWLSLAVFGAFTAPAHADDPAKPDAFLDQPLPAGLPWETQTYTPPDSPGSQKTYQGLGYHSLWSGVELLGKLSGKSVVLPAGLAEWPEERTETGWGWTFNAGLNKTVRPLFERLCSTMGLDWRYDAKADVIALELPWRRTDPRSGRELIGVLLGSRPVDWRKLLQDTPEDAPDRTGGRDDTRDAWRLAFDGLLSRPENLPAAGTLRLYYDSHGSSLRLSGGIVENLFAGTLADAAGQRRVLVLNEQSGSWTGDDPGSVAYYLFDPAGRFIQGGVYELEKGWTGGIQGIQADGEKGITLAVGQGKHEPPPDFFRFVLQGDDLVLQGSTDHEGKERNADETRAAFRSSGGDSVHLAYRIHAQAGD